MAEDAIPAVDAAEVAAMERAAEARQAKAAVGVTNDQVDRMPLDIATTVIPKTGEFKRVETPPPAKGALETLVEQAVAERLHAIEAQLRQQAQWVRHTMHLAMVIGHILRVDPTELEEARKKVDAADAAIRKGE